jgi:hypothetical protein
MADDVRWQIEDIPDQDSVYMRAHRTYFRDGMLQPGVFKMHDGGMSVDWEKYSSAQNTRQRAKDPPANAVISLPVIDIRGIGSLDVRHTPEPDNRAHSDVIGLPDVREDLTEIRMLLLNVSKVAIQV